jgi:hypothetical protein
MTRGITKWLKENGQGKTKRGRHQLKLMAQEGMGKGQCTGLVSGVSPPGPLGNKNSFNKFIHCRELLI